MTVTATEGCTVRLNGEISNSISVAVGTRVSVEVIPDEGYYIERASVNGSSDSVSDTRYKKTIRVTRKTNIAIETGKYCKITVSGNGTGEIRTSTPAENGIITVKNGDSVLVEAIPNTNYLISKVLINGEPDSAFSQQNNAYYQKDIKAQGQDVSVYVEFALKKYTVTTQPCENGAIQVEKTEVEHGESIKVFLIPNEGYTVQWLGFPAEAGSWDSETGKRYVLLKSIAGDTVLTAGFMKISQASFNEIRVSPSPIRQSQGTYVYANDSTVTISTDRSGIRVYDGAGSIIGGNENTKQVTINENTVLSKVELYYKADNELWREWHVHALTTNEIRKIVFDKQRPDLKLAVKSVNNSNFYNKDVTIRVETTDSGDYSGIGSIEYSIDGEAWKAIDINTQIGNSSVSTEFTVSKERNKDTVVVKVRVIDLAGNETQDSISFGISTDVPQITISMTGEPSSRADGIYFTEDRVATITVTERAATFHRGNSFESMVSGLPQGAHIEWECEEGCTRTTHIGKVTFSGEGKYQWKINYRNCAGTRGVVSAGNSIAPFEFVIDTDVPKISVEFNASGDEQYENQNQFRTDRCAKILILEKNFDPERVILTVKKDGATHSLENYANYVKAAANWTHNGDEHICYVTFAEEGEYSFDIACSDKAGRDNSEVDYGSSVAPNTFMIDKTGPSFDVIDASGKDLLSKSNVFSQFQNIAIQIRAAATDSQSGIEKLYYQKVTSAADYVDDAEKWVECDDVSTNITLTPNDRGIFYFKSVDRAGNVSYAHTCGLIADRVEPIVTLTVENPNRFNFFNRDVKVKIEIVEPLYLGTEENEEGFYSGLSNIEYRIEKMSSSAQIEKKTLFSLGGGNKGTVEQDENGLVYKWSGEIVVRKTLFNDNNIKITVDAIDRAGNKGTISNRVAIDATSPEVTITFVPTAGQLPDHPDHFNQTRTVEITVVEENFVAEGTTVAVERGLKPGAEKTGIQEYDDYVKDAANWTHDGKTHTCSFAFEEEGYYTLSVQCTDQADNPSAVITSDEFVIDKTVPQNLAVSYDFDNAVNKVVSGGITYAYWKDNAVVLLSVEDSVSGVDSFEYDYLIEDGASEINRGKTGQLIYLTGYLDTATHSFSIPAQFRGNVAFRVLDRAGNTNSMKDESIVVVVDSVSPVINVEYDNSDARNQVYFKDDRTAIIRIKEANFYAEDVKITIQKTLSNGEVQLESRTLTFTKVEEEGIFDTYQAEILFHDDADYELTVKYTDRSGNEAESFTDRFTVDHIRPSINVTYDSSEEIYQNENQFRSDRVATISVTEHNFTPAGMTVIVKSSLDHAVEKEIIEWYDLWVKNPQNWIDKGNDIHTCKPLVFEDEGHYTFEVYCSDLAGNDNDGVSYGESVSPEAFTIDKSAPTNIEIDLADSAGNEISVVESSDVIAFELFYGDKILLKLAADYTISGKYHLQYIKVDSTIENIETISDGWVEYQPETGIPVEANERLILYVRAEDKAGNVSYAHSKGIVVDDRAPSGTTAPSIDIGLSNPGSGGFYTGNVNVRIAVQDPDFEQGLKDGFFSGLKEVRYSVSASDIGKSEGGILFTSSEGEDERAVYEYGLAKSWSGTITINATTFNSNQVSVSVTAVDNAGNERTTVHSNIKIDVTAPVIEVSYDNNSLQNGRYFEKARTAVIVVTERNFTGDAVKATITNTDGYIPNISGWTQISSGGGNGDGNRWKATITFDRDGDYGFDITCTDQAGNACKQVNYSGDSACTNEFTIDIIQPTIKVTYDNNDAMNGSYYKAARTATITITEHNFSEAGIAVNISATDDGKTVKSPIVSKWVGNGDVHTATIHFTEDAKYTLDISAVDLAGNTSQAFEKHIFYVDQTMPEVMISGVADQSANAGSVRPVITYSDTNIDFDQVTFELVGETRKTVKLLGLSESIHNGAVFTFDDFEKEKEVDDIYTLTAKIADKAGNVSEQQIIFSVNRFGSTYALGQEAEQLNGSYVKKASDITLTETNPNKLKNIKITLFMNSETIVLKEGKDYLLSIDGGNGKWYVYNYTVLAKNFAEDGIYKLIFHSEDEAGNIAENGLDTKNTEINFVVDDTAPSIIFANLESGKTYPEEFIDVILTVHDNLKLSAVTVYLDGKEYKAWSGEELSQLLSENSEFQFRISDETTAAHEVQVRSVDQAGNEYVETISNFYVTTNLFVRYYNNKPLFFGSLAGGFGLIGLIVVVILKRRKKKLV